MLRIMKRFRFEASHRLRFHEGACRNLHGHSYVLEVHVEGEEREEGPAKGMVVDFKALKQAVADVIDNGRVAGQPTIPFDHAVLLHEHDELYKVLKEQNLERQVDDDKGYAYRLRVIGMTEEPTAEYMARLFAVLVQKNLDHLGADVQVVRVDLWETADSCATWEAATHPYDLVGIDDTTYADELLLRADALVELATRKHPYMEMKRALPAQRKMRLAQAALKDAIDELRAGDPGQKPGIEDTEANE